MKKMVERSQGRAKFFKRVYGRKERFWGAEASMNGILINRKM